MKKIVLSLALAVFLFAVVGLAGGAGVAFAHEGIGDPPFSLDDADLPTFNPDDPDTWPHVHAAGHAEMNGFTEVPKGFAPAHFGHRNNPNCANMHDIGGPPNPSGNPYGRR